MNKQVVVNNTTNWAVPCTVLLAVLKLTNIIHIGWLWVFAPIWGPLATIVAVLVIIFVGIFIGALFGTIKDEIKHRRLRTKRKNQMED